MKRKEGMGVLQEALVLHEAGFSVIPIRIDGSKAPFLKEWKPLKDRENIRRIPEDGLRLAFESDERGLAVIGGEFSGGLECLDFDNHKGNDEANVWDAWKRGVRPELLARLVLYQTPRDGWRACWRYARPAEKSHAVAQLSERETIIEMLASGKIILVPGGHPAAHELSKPYIYRQGHLVHVPVISEDERIELLLAARSFNRWIAPEAPPRPAAASGRQSGRPSWLRSPGDDFNARASWEEILEPAGWQVAHWSRADGGTAYWTRPGKSRGISASTDYHEGFFSVFTCNAPPFVENESYTKFAAYAMLYHDGNFKAAAGELTARGFGGLVLTAEEQARLDLCMGKKSIK